MSKPRGRPPGSGRGPGRPPKVPPAPSPAPPPKPIEQRRTAAQYAAAARQAPVVRSTRPSIQQAAIQNPAPTLPGTRPISFDLVDAIHLGDPGYFLFTTSGTCYYIWRAIHLMDNPHKKVFENCVGKIPEFRLVVKDPEDDKPASQTMVAATYNYIYACWSDYFFKYAGSNLPFNTLFTKYFENAMQKRGVKDGKVALDKIISFMTEVKRIWHPSHDRVETIAKLRAGEEFWFMDGFHQMDVAERPGALHLNQVAPYFFPKKQDADRKACFGHHRENTVLAGRIFPGLSNAPTCAVESPQLHIKWDARALCSSAVKASRERFEEFMKPVPGEEDEMSALFDFDKAIADEVATEDELMPDKSLISSPAGSSMKPQQPTAKKVSEFSAKGRDVFMGCERDSFYQSLGEDWELQPSKSEEDAKRKEAQGGQAASTSTPNVSSSNSGGAQAASPLPTGTQPNASLIRQQQVQNQLAAAQAGPSGGHRAPVVRQNLPPPHRVPHTPQMIPNRVSPTMATATAPLALPPNHSSPRPYVAQMVPNRSTPGQVAPSSTMQTPSSSTNVPRPHVPQMVTNPSSSGQSAPTSTTSTLPTNQSAHRSIGPQMIANSASPLQASATKATQMHRPHVPQMVANQQAPAQSGPSNSQSFSPSRQGLAQSQLNQQVQRPNTALELPIGFGGPQPASPRLNIPRAATQSNLPNVPQPLGVPTTAHTNLPANVALNSNPFDTQKRQDSAYVSPTSSAGGSSPNLKRMKLADGTAAPGPAPPAPAPQVTLSENTARIVNEVNARFANAPSFPPNPYAANGANGVPQVSNPWAPANAGSQVHPSPQGNGAAGRALGPQANPTEAADGSNGVNETTFKTNPRQGS